MNIDVADMKNNLHKFIVETDDIGVLSKVQAYFDILKYKQTDWWDLLSEKEIASVERGLQQLDKGQRIPHAKVKHKVDQLLGR
jgi:hypothetical protein